MNILITGMTARHTGGNVSKMVTVIEPLKEILKDIGHEVFQKTVSVNEDLKVYDKIFLFMFPPEKIGVTRRFGAIDAYARYPEKCILCFDDWQYYQFQNGMKNCLESGRFFNWVDKFPNFITKVDLQEIIKGGKVVRDRLFGAASRLAVDPKRPFCIPKFLWGYDGQIKLESSAETFHFDPSRYAIDYVYNNYDLEFMPAKRENKWVLASLFEHDKYFRSLKLTWPILRVGHKKTQQVFDEEKLCKIYQDNWGILSPSYPTSGDGWWRARFIFAYMFENIVYASDEEWGKLGKNIDATKIEKLSQESLQEFSNFQHEVLDKWFMKKEQLKEIFKKILTT